MRSIIATLNKALTHATFGDPGKVLSLTEVGVSPIQPNEVRIQVKARSINPSDLLSIQGVGPYQSSIKLPAIPGFEGVGIVIEKGKDVLSLNIGDRIVSMKMRNSWQEYVVLPAEEALPVPEKISNNEAAQLCINPLTAWLIIQEYKLGKGDIVVGNAANSTMGRLFAQFSTIFGYTFIGIVRREMHMAPLLKLGAALVVNSEDEDCSAKILDYTKGNKPNIGLETIGGKEGEKLIQLLAPASKLIIYGALALSPFTPEMLTHIAKNTKLSYFFLKDWIHKQSLADRKKIFSNMLDAMIENKISLPVAQEFKLSDFKEALIATQQPRSGKVILTSDNLQPLSSI